MWTSLCKWILSHATFCRLFASDTADCIHPTLLLLMLMVCNSKAITVNVHQHITVLYRNVVIYFWCFDQCVCRIMCILSYWLVSRSLSTHHLVYGVNFLFYFTILVTFTYHICHFILIITTTHLLSVLPSFILALRLTLYTNSFHRRLFLTSWINFVNCLSISWFFLLDGFFSY